MSNKRGNAKIIYPFGPKKLGAVIRSVNAHRQTSMSKTDLFSYIRVSQKLTKSFFRSLVATYKRDTCHTGICHLDAHKTFQNLISFSLNSADTMTCVS